MAREEQAQLRELAQLVEAEAEKPAELVYAEKFIREVLGYELKGFHQEWLKIQQANQKSLILAPRGHGKSTICTIAYPLFRLLNNPELRILILSNTSAQACAFLREIKAHLESNFWLRKKFGELRGTPWSESELTLGFRRSKAKEASLTALGILGPVISKHYDIIILDDVVDEQNSGTASQREKLLNWYYKILLPCLEPEGELHIIGTRYHYLDFYGHLIANEFANCHWVYRAISEKAGAEFALWEEKFSLNLLREIRKQAGSVIFNSQYQNDTELMKGAIFKPEWFQFYQTAPSQLEKIIGIDLAISEKAQADFFALVVIGLERKTGKIYVLDWFRDRLSFQSQIGASLRFFQKHHQSDSPVLRVCVENNGYQEAFAQELRRKGLPVKSITRIKDKLSRAYQLQAKLENSEIFFPRQSGQELVEELILFPEAEHDDLFDALELAVSQIRSMINPFPKAQLQVEPE